MRENNKLVLPGEIQSQQDKKTKEVNEMDTKKLTNGVLDIFEELIECGIIDNYILENCTEISPDILDLDVDVDVQDKLLRVIKTIKEG